MKVKLVTGESARRPEHYDWTDERKQNETGVGEKKCKPIKTVLGSILCGLIEPISE